MASIQEIIFKIQKELSKEDVCINIDGIQNYFREIYIKNFTANSGIPNFVTIRSLTTEQNFENLRSLLYKAKNIFVQYKNIDFQNLKWSYSIISDIVDEDLKEVEICFTIH